MPTTTEQTNAAPRSPVRAYSGKPGCACGCRGKYYDAETKAGAMMITKLLAAAAERGVEIDDGGSYRWAEIDGRVYALHFD
jgi:hypothetical protein